MIKSILPQIVSTSSTDNSVEFQLFVAAELECFKGHFPQQPVLPGVAQLDWAIQLGCQHFGYPANVAKLEVLKFQQILLPDSAVTLSIDHNPAKQKLSFRYHSEDRRFASGRIVIGSSK